MSGLGATADIGRRYGLDGSVAFDPKLPSLSCGAACKVGTPGRSALAQRPRLLPFVALIFFVFLEFGFFF